MATAVTIGATGNVDIDGMLSGYGWTGTITYSFPDSSSDYPSPYTGGNGEPTTSGFSQAPSQMQAAINYAIGLIQSYTNATIQYAGTNGADIMVAQSPAANPTSYAYYPNSYASGGDVWFGTAYDYSQASLGNYYFATALHELGHAFGLKHSQETGGPANVAVPSAHDDSEYTVMSYRSYVGGPLTGYTNESYGYPQTYMANDILALQTMYGANYTTHNENTVYTWSPTTGQEFINGVAQLAPGGGVGGSANRIYETIWDGGGVDTYDLSNYTTNLTINLNPGASSVFSSTQLAYLGNGHYAAGNVYNAYLYNNDARSNIDNAIGGTGNDTIIGNAIANVLNGGSGNDTITGGGGNDTIIGGAGTDTAVYSGNRANYSVAYNSSTQTFTITDLRSGTLDGTDSVTGVENFQFADGTVSSATLISQLTPVVIEAIGTTSLVQTGGNYVFNPTAGGTGPTLKYQGAAVTIGQFGGYAPIGAEQTSTGYVIAWKMAGVDQYTVWSTDGSGNYIANVIGAVSATSTALESLEPTFHQDLNGDGVIGIPTTSVVEAYGSTSLVKAGAYYLLNPVAGGTGPSIDYGGAPVSVGQFGSYSLIGAEQTSSGYQVAWKSSSADLYIVWNLDSNGHYVSHALAGATGTGVSGSTQALEAYETTFHQDLNGDGTIGIPVVSGTTIEAAGSTALVQSGANYFLNPVAGGSGPELKYGGAPVSAGQFGSYALIGAEQTSGGYQVAWKSSTADLYIIWNIDSSGNYVSHALAGPTGTGVSGSSAALESYETTFHQDLNGDGTIGVPAAAGTTIESYGSTALVQVGSNYFLDPVAGGTGPEIKYGGSPVSAGQFGSYVLIGAEQTSGGYQVAWKSSTADLYIIWNLDSNGNYVSHALAGSTGTGVSGNSSELQAYETTFHQDLNGNGVVGAQAAPLASAGAVAGITNNDGFVFAESGAGPLPYTPEKPDTMPAPASWASEVVEHLHDASAVPTLADYLASLHLDHQLLV
ncbi:M10 family metallopeptidase C-terminal domain-containing protein [Bradyrhizobium sp. UFLA05-153]